VDMVSEQFVFFSEICLQIFTIYDFVVIMDISHSAMGCALTLFGTCVSSARRPKRFTSSYYHPTMSQTGEVLRGCQGRGVEVKYVE